MHDIIHQKIIDNHDDPEWKDIFKEREYNYLKNIINGLIKFGMFDELMIQFAEKGRSRTLHIFEPFCTLNYLGYMAPSVVSISFDNTNKINFLEGGDNGLSIFSDKLTLSKTANFPCNPTLEIDFWHFVDNIGSATKEIL